MFYGDITCFRLSFRLGFPKFHQDQLEFGRIGYLLRVLQEAEIAAGERGAFGCSTAGYRTCSTRLTVCRTCRSAGARK
jgi:hypothetical protein